MNSTHPTLLGDALHPSPLSFAISENLLVPAHIEWPGGTPPDDLLLFEKAGPRGRLFFDPATTVAAIVTCGGLCPGLNNVIRSVTRELIRGYGVKSVWGIRSGYRGLDPSIGKPPLDLTEDAVEEIHQKGGTLLGTSRGPVDVTRAVDFLIDRGVNILFTVGGDGTQRGGHALFTEAQKRGHPLAVVGIPKTIDNDVLHVTRTFGFGTAVSEAVRVIDSAHTEARSVENGVSVVKLMGRHAGFIAAAATVASQDVNFCLVPEQPFSLDGLLAALEKRLDKKSHAVVVVAEGAGQELLGTGGGTDASGNAKLRDIGQFLRDEINAHFKSRGLEMTMRYFDPSYQIRGCPANTEDALLCDRMGRHAVHAAMSGRTGLVISYLNGHFVHVPINLIAAGGKRLDLEGELWRAVISSTGQPDLSPLASGGSASPPKVC
ncbi:ATP-dependent 6-phosphofructokinase [Luteolibacter yonseiensis]|uniref:ATP-dependent 6-phosphofructokinase n=1 Tax=Luteolibacter yonseiensis TaxID=1144680 RepID=A0A934QXK8_9BACT|nr:ATP-dependent 6-phosphofructokinase [Luteolibacter yonseiensis]MBK1814578.1 ATP-dependent 6-phosphofructokinase [Luteolibacter yonseiensis]